MGRFAGAVKSCMNGGDKFFVDSNVLLYAVDRRSDEKRASAEAWIAELWKLDAGCLSWQVLHEFYSVALRKLNVPSSDARSVVRSYEIWNPGQPGMAALERAWHWCDAPQLNFWDALIVSSAEQAGCRWLLSEDFQAGRRFGELTVVNPF